MNWQSFQHWLGASPLPIVALTLFIAMGLAAGVGIALRTHRRSGAGVSGGEPGGQEGYIVSAVLGLMALLLGFTFSLAVDRFETRRHLVLEEANAIGTAYLRTQLLPQPHRQRMSDLLIRYTDNRLALSNAPPRDVTRLVKLNDALLTEIWSATSDAFDSIKQLDFSSAYLDSVNAVIDLDASRKTARAARVPPGVFLVLFIYLVTTAGVLGYVLHGGRGRMAAGFLLCLLTLSLILVIDIDRPNQGGVVEGQAPMEALRSALNRDG
jgi:hypothetical protein